MAVYAVNFTLDKGTDFEEEFDLIEDDGGCYKMDNVNIYQLTSHLEELYLMNADLCDRIRQLEKDNELLKSYAWEPE